MSFSSHLYAICMSFICQLYVLVCHSYIICTSLICHSHVTTMCPYIICMYSYAIHISLVCTRCYQYVTRIFSCVMACHSYVLVCYPYVTHMYLYAIHMSLVCTGMSSICHSYVLVCHPHITCMYLYVICMSLVCTCMSSVCHSYLKSFNNIGVLKGVLIDLHAYKNLFACTLQNLFIEPCFITNLRMDSCISLRNGRTT